MDHTEAQTLLRSLVNVSIDAAGKSEEDLTIADLLELTLQSYEAPCSDCSRNDAGDVLLFKCGLWDWGQGECLQVDFVRQFSVNDLNGDFSHLEQLHATLHYPAELAADKDVAVSLCSADCASLAAFRQQVTESTAYCLTENVRPEGIKIYQERV